MSLSAVSLHVFFTIRRFDIALSFKKKYMNISTHFIN